MKKYILLILITIGLFCCFLLYNSKPIHLHFDYPNYKSTANSSPIHALIQRDTILMIFHSGFNSDLVRMIVNEKEIYHKRLTYINGMPITASFEFKREPHNSIQIYINHQKTELFQFDDRFDCGIIDWNAETNNLTLEYDIQKEMVGFD